MGLDDLDILESVAEFLIEFAPQFVADMFREREPIPSTLVSSKNGIQSLFGADGWWTISNQPDVGCQCELASNIGLEALRRSCNGLESFSEASKTHSCTRG
jgi:hypothetical protein